MSETKPRKSAQISTTVSPEVFEALREYRFDQRIEKMTDIVSEAVNEYMVNHNIQVKGNDAPAEKPTPKA